MIDCSCEPHCLERDADHFFLSTSTGHVRDYIFLARKPLPLQGIPREWWLHPCGLEWPWWIHQRHRRTGRTRSGPWRGCREQAHRSTGWRVGWLVGGCFYFLFPGFPCLIATCVSHNLSLHSFLSSGNFISRIVQRINSDAFLLVWLFVMYGVNVSMLSTNMFCSHLPTSPGYIYPHLASHPISIHSCGHTGGSHASRVRIEL